MKIISRKYEVFPYFGLYSIMLIFFFSLLVFSLIYKYTLKKIKNNLKLAQYNFFKNLNNNLDIKIFIMLLLLMELIYLYKGEGFIFYYT